VVKLEVEITDKMYEELEKCTKTLLPIDHVVRDILASHIRCEQKREERVNTFLGFPVEQWVQSLTATLGVLLQEKQQPPVFQEKQQPPAYGAESLRQE